MLHRTEGIVLRTKEYGEADLIVTFLSKDFGLIHTFAKSPRKTKSRFGSSLEPLSYVRLSFWGKENAGLPRLTQSDIILTFQNIRDSYECFFKVTEIVELVLRCCPERDVSHTMFPFFIRALQLLQKGCPDPLLFLSLKIKILKIAGFAPRLHSCAKCGAEGHTFYFQEGAVICDVCNHHSVHIHRLSPGAIKLYACISRWKIDRMYRVKPSDILIQELTSLIDSHVKYYITKESKVQRTECSV